MNNIGIANNNLRKLQKIQLYILLEFRRICNKHRLRYFLTGGTLLGCIRHQGFIPWDDDIDVAMPREDYEIFINLCNTELSPEFFLQTNESDEDSAYLFSKLRLVDSKRRCLSGYETKTMSGIDIDIFPYDNIPNDIRANIQYNLCLMLRGMYVLKCKWKVLNRSKSLKKTVGIIICRLAATAISKKSILKLADIVSQRYNTSNTTYSMCLVGGSYSFKREKQKTEVISEYVKLPFEGYLFSVPKKHDEFLKTLYGDYMTLPPKEKQVAHHIISEIDFGKYDNIENYLVKYEVDE